MSLSESEIKEICEGLGGKLLPKKLIPKEPQRIARVINTCSLDDMLIIFDSDDEYDTNSIIIKKGNLVVNIGSTMSALEELKENEVTLINKYAEYREAVSIEKHGKEIKVWTP